MQFHDFFLFHDFFAWTFLNFLAYCATTNIILPRLNNNILLFSSSYSDNNGPTNTINISLPSPAGTAAMRSSSKSKSIGNKKWEKYNKVKKAIKTHSDEEILQPPTKPRYKC